MHVAIIGGTGFVGSYIVDELLEQGHEVSMLVRAGSEHKVRHFEASRRSRARKQSRRDGIETFCHLW